MKNTQSKSQPIIFWNRGLGQEQEELIYGESFMRWFYESTLGQTLSNLFFSRAPFSQMYGAYQSSPLSRKKIEPFIRDMHIKMEEFEAGPFASFNDFFIRRFRPGARTFAAAPQLGAPAEGRYLAFEALGAQPLPVKGHYLEGAALLGSEEKAKPFQGGPAVICRLCPTDYHRFHFPDEGKVVESYRLHGPLHSVNPIALNYKSDILFTNERHVTLLETQHFGRMAYVEVGALCVGRIVQSFQGEAFHRGDEKGYFLFGASTVVLLGEAGSWALDGDLLQQSARGRETFLRLGESMGQRRG